MKTSKVARFVAATAAAALCALLAACSAPMSMVEAGAGRDTAMPNSAVSDMELVPLDGQMVDARSTASQGERSIVKSGAISIEVGDVQHAATEVASLTADLGGYVESQSVGASNYNATTIDTAHLTLRVPADQFDAAFTELAALGSVTDENRSASDVTVQHVDLQARVEALQASVDRLTELMAKAATTGELIEAEAALSTRQAELDGLRAQLQALEGQVNEATIWVSVSSNRVLADGPGNFWEGLLAGLKSLGVAGAGALVLLGVLLPWLAIAGVITLIVLAVVRSIRRRKARRSTAAPHPQPAEHVAPQSSSDEQPADGTPTPDE